MQEFLDSLSNPSWWMSVVIIGLLINIASSYLQRKMDFLYSRFSESRRAAIELKNRRFEADVTRVLQDRERIVELKIDVLMLNLRTIFITVVGVLILFFMDDILKSVLAELIYLPLHPLVFDVALAVIGLSIFTIVLAYVSQEREKRRLLREVERRRQTS